MRNEAIPDCSVAIGLGTAEPPHPSYLSSSAFQEQAGFSWFVVFNRLKVSVICARLPQAAGRGPPLVARAQSGSTADFRPDSLSLTRRQHRQRCSKLRYYPSAKQVQNPRNQPPTAGISAFQLRKERQYGNVHLLPAAQ